MYKRGVIVLVPFPFSDLSGSKVRPAIIVSNGMVGKDIVVLFITSKIKTKHMHQITITPDQINGLKTSSRVVCSKFATLEAKIVLGEIGMISDPIQKKIDSKIRLVLGL